MGKKKILAIVVTAILTLNIGTVALATNNEVVHLNNSGTRKEGQNKIIQNKEIPSSYTKVSENSNLELYLNENTLGIKVKNKVTGYIWDSTIDIEEEDLNQIWQGLAESAITIEYMNEKGKVEKVSISNGKPKMNINKTSDGFKVKLDFNKLGFEFEMKVTLEDTSLNVSIDNDSIKEKKEKIQLQSIYVYPFMGATKNQDISGYMFVPDGSGGLIRLEEKNSISTEPYVNKIYGDDYGIKGVTDSGIRMNEVEKIKYPVFGMVHNIDENGFLAIIDKGSEFGEINAYPSGITTKYNWITSRFIFRDSYFQQTNKKGDGVVVNQKEANKFDISVTYNFLSKEDANYIGMAKKYQSVLLENGTLTKKENEKSDIPLKLEFLMSENEKAFIGRKLVEMTTIEDIRNITSSLIDENINNLQIVARGWTKGGAGGAALNHKSFENKVGSYSDWEKLNKELENKDILTYMYTDYSKVFENAKGVSLVKDSAQTISEQIIKSGYLGFNFVAPKTAKDFFENDQEYFQKYGIKNIAIDSIGYNLYSNYNKKNQSTRTEAMEISKEILGNSSTNNALYEPNDYLWKYTDSYYGIPMSSSNYTLITDNVPFVQIVLKGYVNYFAPELNFIAGSKDALLQMIDYSAYPSYYITKEDSVKLINTSSRWLYTSKFDIWNDQIIEQYNFINSALKNVEGQTIIDRNILEDGIVETVYSNNTRILVNYNESAYEYNGVLIDGKDFKVIGGN